MTEEKMSNIEKQYNDLKLMLADAVYDIKKAAQQIDNNSSERDWGRKLGLCDALSTLSSTLWLLGINEELGLEINPEKELFNINEK